ncbi:MAG: hypothetical protein JWM11_1749 [Planctomycetaceae bacterium]|nr:hypothetical protein [Planctomycetaceae bacterium]
MSVKAGVWIDHRQAILVLVTDNGNESKKFSSGVESTERSTLNHSYTPTDFVAEDTLDRKAASHLKIFYDEVISGLQGSKSLLILGPGEAKGEFQKRLGSKKIQGLVVAVETSDKLTEGQLVSKVTQYFAKHPITKATSSR